MAQKQTKLDKAAVAVAEAMTERLGADAFIDMYGMLVEELKVTMSDDDEVDNAQELLGDIDHAIANAIKWHFTNKTKSECLTCEHSSESMCNHCTPNDPNNQY